MFLINIKWLNRALKFIGVRVWVLKTYNGRAVNQGADSAQGETYVGISIRLLSESGAKAKVERKVAK